MELKHRVYDVMVGPCRDYEVDFIIGKNRGSKTIMTMDHDLLDDSYDIRYMNLVDWLQYA